MNIIIPLGGKGERFKTQKYHQPKPLVKVFGKPIIECILDSLKLNNKKIHCVIIPYNSELENYRFEDLIRYKYPNTNFLFIKMFKQTDGAAETIYEALSILEQKNVKDMPIISMDGDNFYKIDIIQNWNQTNTVFVFEDNSNDPIYSYIETKNEKIINIAEKQKISNLACTGAYGFDSWIELKKTCKYIIDNDIRQKNEYYVSSVILNMIKSQREFTYKMVNINDYICLGTPLLLNMFILNNQSDATNKRICFDLDNTLVTYPVIPNDYSTCLPIQKNIDFLKYLKKMGNTIIIHTARRMKTHKSNLGRVNADIGKLTFDMLDKMDIPYDEIYFGKPDADFYIDDKGVNCFENLEKELGYCNCDKVKPRDFNKITKTYLDVIRKDGKDLSGEIYYYSKIPENIKYLFPKMIHYDSINYKWYDVELIDGITLNNLFLLENLSTDMFSQILQLIDIIHNQPQIDATDNVNIYENYNKKMKTRHKEYDYSVFPDSNIIYDYLTEQLQKYEENQNGIKTIIHGDLVFTNILVDKKNQIKFIDMRGKQGDTLTIYGDKMYDYAKLYQSIIGYDEILQGKFVKNTVYKNALLNMIECKVIENYGPDGLFYLKLITSMLLFTLIPLHNNDKCIQYYNLMLTTLP
jgi:capsule biosynthesis phosphatase